MIENKMYLLAVDLIKKRYPKGWGETADDAIIRELKEETGIVYDANNLKELLLLEYYQLNYPTRRDEVINRLIRTKFYFGQYRGIDLKSINRTENEVKDLLEYYNLSFGICQYFFCKTLAIQLPVC